MKLRGLSGTSNSRQPDEIYGIEQLTDMFPHPAGLASSCSVVCPPQLLVESVHMCVHLLLMLLLLLLRSEAQIIRTNSIASKIHKVLIFEGIKAKHGILLIDVTRSYQCVSLTKHFGTF